MLILTRKPGQTVRIGDDIQITILEDSGNTSQNRDRSPERSACSPLRKYEQIKRKRLFL